MAERTNVYNTDKKRIFLNSKGKKTYSDSRDLYGLLKKNKKGVEKMIQITDRDKAFLLKLNETGDCNTQILFKFYPKRYGKDRI